MNLLIFKIVNPAQNLQEETSKITPSANLQFIFYFKKKRKTKILQYFKIFPQ